MFGIDNVCAALYIASYTDVTRVTAALRSRDDTENVNLLLTGLDHGSFIRDRRSSGFLLLCGFFGAGLPWLMSPYYERLHERL